MDTPKLTFAIFYVFNAAPHWGYLPKILWVANDDYGSPTISDTT